METRPFGAKHKRYTLIFLCTFIIISISTILEQIFLRQLDDIFFHFITIIYVGLVFLLMAIFKSRSRYVFIFSFLIFSVILIVIKAIGDTSGIDMFLLFFCIGIKNKYFKLHKGWYFIAPVVVVIAITLNSAIQGGTAATITKSLTMLVTTAYIYLNEFGILDNKNQDFDFLRLTKREQEYIQLLYKEFTTQELAAYWNCTESNVKQIRYGLREKIGAKTDIMIALWAKESGLI